MSGRLLPGACGLMLATLLACGAADAQTTLLGTPPAPLPKPVPRHAVVKHKPVRHPARPATRIPVVAPRYAGPPRHAVTPAKAATLHKAPARTEAAAVPVAPKLAPKPVPPPLPADVGSNTGLHLPRYASLKSDDVNMRVGPAERYPVIWTYKRRELPVRITREFDIWRLVEDMDGIKGWVHQATLTGRRTFVVTGTEDRTLRADASETADAVATLKPGVVGRIRACDAGKTWCQVQVQDYRGWLQRDAFWGADPDEVVAP